MTLAILRSENPGLRQQLSCSSRYVWTRKRKAREVKMMVFFCVVTPCRLEGRYQSFHFQGLKTPLPVLILSQMNLNRVLQTFFPVFHFNIIPSMPASSELSLSFGFPNQSFICISYRPYTRHMPRPPQTSDYSNNIW